MKHKKSSPHPKKVGHFNRYFCSSGQCTLSEEIEIDPCLDPDSREFAELLKIPVEQTTRDVTGKHWCLRPMCQVRCILINWGASHKWPEVDFLPYAIAQGEEYWKLTAMVGDDGRAMALYQALGLGNENEA